MIHKWIQHLIYRVLWDLIIEQQIMLKQKITRVIKYPGLIFDFGVSLNQNKVVDIKCRWNYGDQYDDDYDDDYGDNYDDYYVLNLIQLLMQNSHSLLLFSFSIL